MNMEKFHFITIDDDNAVCFFTDTKRFIKVNNAGRYLAEIIAKNISYEEVCKCVNISKDEFELYKEKIYSLANCTVDNQETFRSIKFDMRKLERLVIHVTNDCNLRCKYCYAQGGSYGGKRAMLTKEMAEKILDVFYSQFEFIQNVQMFGGEPLMNIKVMERICEYIRCKDLQRKQKTNIALVTNATLINDEFISLVKKYEIHITVSYDGDPAVNDILRPYADGSSTSENILNNTLQLYKETNQPETIEVTYTQYHINHDIKIMQIVSNIKAMFENTAVHLVPVSGEIDCSYIIKDLRPFVESIDEIFGNVSKGYSYSIADRIFYGLNKEVHPMKYICVAGNSTLSVSVEGNIYPCFMFTNERGLCLGNIAEPNVFKSAVFISKLHELEAFSDKTRNPECKKCFIKTLCVGCLGLNANYKNNHFEINSKICEMFRQMAEHAIRQYIINEMSTEVNYNAKTEKK